MRTRFRLLLLVVALLSPVLLPAVEQSGIMPEDQIKRGMKGIGKTVFQGTAIEEFNVEVIDILRNTLPRQDMILVKISGHNLEHTGVVAGMSGSPIYIDGKLIGALAYAWSFSKEPIAGITPIESMIEDMNHPLEPTTPSPVAMGKITGRPSSGDFLPVISPLMVSGVAPSVMDDLSETLKSYRLTPIRAGGGNMLEPSPELQPGAAVGVTLVRGDIDMDAIGTVTYLIGNKVLAFGHPFLGGGQESLPMTGAYVHTILPSLDISTKMASSLSEVGSLVQDRQSGIFGEIGKKVPMIPIDIRVTNPATKYENKYHMEMGWNASLSAKLLDTILKSSLMAGEPVMGENTTTLKMEMKFAGQQPLTLTNSYYNNQGPYDKSMLESLQRLIFNPFEEVELQSLNIEVSVDHRIRLGVIKTIWMEEEAVRPGGVAHLHITLKPFEGDDIDYLVEIEVSKDFKPGDKFIVGVAGGREIMPPTAPPVNFRGIMDQFAAAYQSTDMVVIQQLPTVGAITEGFLLNDLPPSAIRIMSTGNSTGSALRQDLKFTPIHTQSVISGKARIVVQVE